MIGGIAIAQPGWTVSTGALVALAIAVCCHALFLRPPKKTSTTKRPFTLRIEGIPIDKSREALECDLKSIVERDSDLEKDALSITQHSLVQSDRTIACGTATFHTSIPANEVIRRLHQAGSMLQYRFDVKFYGVTPLYEARGGADVDVIAVPGLGSHAIGSWKSPSSNDVWLRDYLPDHVPNIRVLLYGYDTSLLGSDSKDSIEDLGSRFLELIKAFRADTTDRRPIIFIGHSLGGLLIKEALVRVRKMSDDPQNLALRKACYGLLLFGVPNLGLRNEQLNSIVKGQPNQVLIRDLVVDGDSEPSPFLKRISDQFSECCKGQHRVISFFERKHSSTVQIQPDGTLAKTGPKTFMVTQKSATSTGLTAVADENNIPLNTDHSGLVKYESRTQEEYIIVKEKLKILVAEAKREVGRRFIGNNLTPEQERLWSNLNQPPYTAFRESPKLAKPEKGTLGWLVHGEVVDHNYERPNMPQQSLRMKDFISWRDSSKSGSLLVTAPPGRGKSVLSSFVLGHLESGILQKTPPASKVIYYFCNIRNDEASRNANSVLRALVIQLCGHQQRLFRILPSEYEQRDRFLSASFDSLWHIFERMLRDETYARVYCVIDGLDVYQEGMDELISKLTKEFSHKAEAESPLLKLLCTSRPEKAILNLWEPSMHKILRCNPQDLDVFIESRVGSLGKSFTDNMRQTIKEQLRKHAEGTFLWLEVVIRRMRSIDVPTPRKIKATIETSPQDLDDLYHLLVQRLVRKDRDNARLLAWVVYARCPLDLKALEDAMAINPTEECTSYKQCLEDRPCLASDEIHKVFGALLDVIEGKVYLIHQSVKDYFERLNPLQHSFSGMSPQLALACVSIKYLGLEEFDSREEAKVLIKRYPLLQYAAIYWYSHINTVEDIRPQIPLLKRILLPDTSKAQVWIKANLQETDPYNTSKMPVRLSEIAITFDIGWLADILLSRVSDEFSDNFAPNCLSKVVQHEGVVLKVLLKHERGKDLRVTRGVVKSIAGNYDKEMMELLLDERNEEVEIIEDVVKAAAGNYKSGEVMTLLLDRRGADVQITEEVVKAAAGNKGSGKKVMTLLLDRRGADVQITEEVVKAAAGNIKSGEEVMTLLLNRRGADVPITEEVVKAAAGNEGSGRKVMTLLLDRRGADVQITEEVVKTAAGNGGRGEEVMTLLLDRRGADVQITEEVVKAAAGNDGSGNEVMTLLFDRRGVDVQITEEVVKAAAGNDRSGEVMTLLLDRRGADVQITEEVVKAVAGNWRSGNEVIILLFNRRGADVPITEEVVKAAVGNVKSGEEMIILFLDRRGADVQITEKVVKAAAGNSGRGEEVMTLLLNRRGVDVQITEEVVKAAAGNYWKSKEVMTLLINRRGADVQITEEVVKVAVGNDWCSKEVMTLLFDRRGADVQITEEVVKVAAGNWRSGNEVMTLLFDRRGVDIQITEEVVKAVAENDKSGEVMTLLLDRRGADVPITEEVVKAAVGNIESGEEMIILFLDRRGADVQITEEVVKAAAGNSTSGEEMIILFLDQRGADVQITEEVVKAAAGNYWSSEEVMTLLLNRRGADVPITEEVVKAAAGNGGSGRKVMTLLLDRRGADVQITEEVVKAAAGNYGSGRKVMTLLLDRRGADVPITEEVVKAAAGNCWSGKEVMTLLLDRRGADVQITEEVVKAAAGNERSGRKVMTLLLDRRGADVQITEEVVKTAAGNGGRGEEVMTLLLDRRGADVQITEEVVKAAAGNEGRGEKVMTLLLNRRGADVQITEEVVKAAAGNNWSSEKVMTLLLNRRGADVQITEEVVKAAAGSDGRGEEVMTLLLNRRGADVQITEEVVKAAAGNKGSGKKVMTLLLDRRGADVQRLG